MHFVTTLNTLIVQSCGFYLHTDHGHTQLDFPLMKSMHLYTQHYKGCFNGCANYICSPLTGGFDDYHSSCWVLTM